MLCVFWAERVLLRRELRSGRDSIKGYLSVITTGRNANGNVVIDAGNKFQAELGLGQDQQATFLPDEVKTELDVGGSTGKVNFEFVSTSGWGEARTPLDFTKWDSTIETKELKRSTESIDADAGIEDHTQLSAEATREGAFLNFESESYKSDLTLKKFFPEAVAVNGGIAFDRVNMKSNDSWSFLSLGGGQIKTYAGQDGEVIATGGSSATAIETLTYTASATRKLESIGQEWDYFADENRNSNYTKTIVSTATFDPNDPEAFDPDPIITGDDRVVVTGTQWFLTVRKMALGPRPEDVYREYIESVFDLATGQRKGRSNTPDYTAGLGGMAPGGDPTPRDEWITTYEANWDPRNFYQADLDGIPLPEDRYLHLDAHLYKLPEGFVAPTSNTDGRTWTEYVGIIGFEFGKGLLQGAVIHPVWSVDRQEWVPLAELAEGERLQGLDGLAVILSVSLSRVSQSVYNIEVHGEHVYQVGELGVLVHNVCDPELLARWGAGSFDDVTKNVMYHFREHAA